MTAIIFGANGQDGHYLAELLRTKNVHTIGVSRNGPWLKGDVRDERFVHELIATEKPAYIFHLAADSTTRHEALMTNHQTISTGSLHILEAVKKTSTATKVFLSGSGLQFENTGIPINEETPFAATSAYAVERIHSVYAARYFRSLGIRAYAGYFFNHDSPLRSTRHVSKMISEAVKRIAQGSGEMIEIGDPNTRKEWGFAGDIMEAAWTLVNQEQEYEAVLGTGEAYSIQEWIETCCAAAGVAWEKHFRTAQNFTPAFSVLVSDPERIRGLGWAPKTSFQQLAHLMLNH